MVLISPRGPFSFPAPMRLRTPIARALVLGGALWVQCVLVGPGVHDPGCAHHRPGSTGSTHVHGAAGAPDATQPRGHAHHGAPNPAVASHGAAPHRADPGTGDTPTGDDGCTCLGICVPGALVGTTLPGAGLDVDLATARSAGGSIAGPVAAVLPPPPSLLPPSTGPPRGA